MIGPLELLVVLLVVVVLFSSKKLPDVMGELGKSIARFKAGLKGKDDAGDGKA